MVNVSTPRQRNTPTISGAEQCHTVPELLHLLKLDETCVQKQADVLRVWLRTHPPDHDLRVSLLSNGYGHIMDEAVGRPLRKSPATMKHSA